MILNFYLGRKFAHIFFYVFFIFVIFMALVDLIEQLRKYSAKVNFDDIIILTMLNLPEKLYEIMPLMVIIAASWTFVSLARSSELVVVRSVGKSSLASTFAPTLVIFMIAALTVSIFNPIVAATSSRYIDLKEELTQKRISAISIGKEGLWLRQADDTGHTIIRARRANADATILYDVTLVKLGQDNLPQHRIEAKNITLINEFWRVHEAIIWPISLGLNPQKNQKIHKALDIPTTITQEQITDQFGKPSTISIWNLSDYIIQLETAGFSARRYGVWMQSELAKPIFFWSMMMLAAAFCMAHSRFGGTGFSVLMAILIGFSLFYAKNFIQILGENGQLPILISAWAPSIGSLFIAYGLFVIIEDA